MLKTWIRTFGKTLGRSWILKQTSFTTKQGVHVFNEWSQTPDGNYFLVSVVFDNYEILGSCISDNTNLLGTADEEKVRGRFDLSSNVKYAKDLKDLELNKRLNRESFEKVIDTTQERLVQELVGVKIGDLVCTRCEKSGYKVRAAFWMPNSLVDIVEINPFKPVIRKEDTQLNATELGALNRIIQGVLLL